ncbi:hypothetical protein [Streptomyces melanogenes]|uniref:Uncharacterized protein n=1 Tax=Streptomyces melanogenes TaxID=67326 RepID=A0ABZ1XUV2_9ACTN|nr:hypothetical protein [Streptomyces melanogenes]
MDRAKQRRAKVDPDSGVEDVTVLVMEWLGEQGIHALLRVDPERDRNQWTFSVAHGPLTDPVRIDGSSVNDCVGRALTHLKEQGISVPL